MKYTFLNRFIFNLFTFIFLIVCSVQGYMVESTNVRINTIWTPITNDSSLTQHEITAHLGIAKGMVQKVCCNCLIVCCSQWKPRRRILRSQKEEELLTSCCSCLERAVYRSASTHQQNLLIRSDKSRNTQFIHYHTYQEPKCKRKTSCFYLTGF